MGGNFQNGVPGCTWYMKTECYPVHFTIQDNWFVVSFPIFFLRSYLKHNFMKLSCMYCIIGHLWDFKLSWKLVGLTVVFSDSESMSSKTYPSVSKLMLWQEKTQLWPRIMLMDMLLVAIDLLKPLHPLSNHSERHTTLDKFPRGIQFAPNTPIGHRDHWPEFVHFSGLTC